MLCKSLSVICSYGDDQKKLKVWKLFHLCVCMFSVHVDIYNMYA